MRYVIFVCLFGFLILNSIPFVSGPVFLKPFSYKMLGMLLSLWIMCFYLISLGIIGLFLTLLIKKLKSFRSGVLIYLYIVVVYFLSYATLPYIFKEINLPKEIKVATHLIEAINIYKIKTGNYPENLEALMPKYIDRIVRPRTLCIDKFHYQKGNDMFNLYFVQKVSFLEIERVIYSPSRDKIMGKIMYKPKDTRFKNWYTLKED